MIRWFLFPITLLLFIGACIPEAPKPELTYLMREPKEKQSNPPLLVLMHGYGSNEQDLFDLADQLPDQYLIVSLRAPYAIGKNGYAWFNISIDNGVRTIDTLQADSSRLAVLKFLEDFKAIHAYDTSKVYLSGFSQGGIMSYSVGLTQPSKVAGIAPLSGRLLEQTKTRAASKQALKSLQIFIAHGTSDAMLNIDYARSAKDWLISQGLQPEYHEYPIAHQISPDVLRDWNTWLKNK